jgi:site-specific DNA recombinase
MKVLCTIRQSKKKELSESPESQRQDIHRWVADRGDVVIGEACDIGVSAKISPFRRKDLGPWLSDPALLAQWDVLAIWKIDRIVRDMTHFYGELMPRLRQLGKHVVAVSEGIDTRTSSELEIALRVSMAQEELKKLRDRASNSRRGLRDKARWAGGSPYFGTCAVKTETGHRLVHDVEAVEVLYTARDMLRAGYNPNYIASFLNQEGVMTAWDRHAVRMGREPKGRIWRRKTLVDMLSSPHLMGYAMYQGEIIRDDEGQPRRFFAPIFERDEWDEIQALLSKPKRQYRRLQEAMLRGVVFCNSCGRTMYRHPGGDRDIRRYTCAVRSLAGITDCSASGFPADQLEQMVEELFLDSYGGEEIVEVAATAVLDHTGRLNEIAEALDALERDRYMRGRFAGEDGERRFNRLYGSLESERDELTQSQRGAGVRYTRTGETYGDVWERGTESDRGDLLRQHGVFVMAQWRRADFDTPLMLSPYVHIYFPLLDDARRSERS